MWNLLDKMEITEKLFKVQIKKISAIIAIELAIGQQNAENLIEKPSELLEKDQGNLMIPEKKKTL